MSRKRKSIMRVWNPERCDIRPGTKDVFTLTAYAADKKLAKHELQKEIHAAEKRLGEKIVICSLDTYVECTDKDGTYVEIYCDFVVKPSEPSARSSKTIENPWGDFEE